MKAYDAYCIALKNPDFRTMANKCRSTVESGSSIIDKFTFIVDGKYYMFGYHSIYDETIPGYEAAPFYCSLNVRKGRKLNKAITIR